MKISVFTIASKNYLAYARVLLASVAKHHPEYDLYLCLVDRVDGYFDPSKEPFIVISADQIEIPTFNDMALRYDIMELNTAVKPYMFQWLFKNTQSDAVIYLDPDIRVYSRFHKLEEILKESTSIVLTPHLTKPLEDGKIPNDYHMLQSGVFNLGFIAARRCKEALNYLSWWGRRLATQANAEFEKNLFTDQRWCDLAPCYLDNLYILKDHGHNVAYWNLKQRQVNKSRDGLWMVDETSLVFFHFSGVNSDNRSIVSKHQNRISWDDIPHFQELFNDYYIALIKSGWDQTKNWPYAYNQISEDFVVSPIMRRIYRSLNPESLSIAPSNVASVLIQICNEPAEQISNEEKEKITRLMFAIYAHRDDLKAAFDIYNEDGRRQFISWFSEAGPREYGLPKSVTSFVDSQVPETNQSKRAHEAGVLNEIVHAKQNQASDASYSNYENKHTENEVVERPLEPKRTSLKHETISISNLLALNDNDFVTNAYLVFLGRFPDIQGRSYYAGKINNNIDKLNVICQIYKSPERRQKNNNYICLDIAIIYRIWLSLPNIIQKPVNILWGALNHFFQNKSSSFNTYLKSSPFKKNGSRIEYLFKPANIQQLLDTKSISNLMYYVWQSRPDLQEAFDLSIIAGQQAFIGWYEASAKREYGIDPDASELPCTKEIENTPFIPEGDNGANLIGYAHAELGMGEHVRMTAAALNNTDISFAVVNFDYGVSSRKQATLDYGELSLKNQYKANIFHINADQMLPAYCNLGHEFFSQRYNIGYWAWELSKCPDNWMHSIKIMDEIWAPSRFIQESFLEKADIPVEYMPLCVTTPPIKNYTRNHFSLPDNAYIFLYTFDFYSYLDRKNPFAAILAFKEAFPNKFQKTVLVLKTMNGDENSLIWSKMLDLINGDNRIIVINKTLSRDEVLGLFNISDCFVSLHRSEGFGRGPAEAMYLGKPVIVTNYSGNTDFTLPDNSCLVNFKLIPVEPDQYPFYQNQVWADPDIEHASWYMKKVYEDQSFSRTIGLKGKSYIHKNYSQDAVGTIYAKRLKALGFG